MNTEFIVLADGTPTTILHAASLTVRVTQTCVRISRRAPDFHAKQSTRAVSSKQCPSSAGTPSHKSQVIIYMPMIPEAGPNLKKLQRSTGARVAVVHLQHKLLRSKRTLHTAQTRTRL